MRSFSPRHRQLEFLHGRTDTDVLLIAVRSNLEHHNQPFVFYSSERVASFWETITKKTVEDLALQMEGFCISGVEGTSHVTRFLCARLIGCSGLARNHKQELLEAKQRVAALILQKLRESFTLFSQTTAASCIVPGAASTRGHINKMYYVNFEDHITAKFGIVLENWPIQKFAAPGSFSSLPVLNVIQSAFEKDLTRFRSMDDGEWEAWMEAHRAGTAGPAVTAQAPATGTAGIDSENDGVQTTPTDDEENTPLAPAPGAAATSTADAANEQIPAAAAPTAAANDEQVGTAAWAALFAAAAAAPQPAAAAIVNDDQVAQAAALPVDVDTMFSGAQKRAFADAFVNYMGPDMVKRKRKTRSDKGVKRKKATGENAASVIA